MVDSDSDSSDWNDWNDWNIYVAGSALAALLVLALLPVPFTLSHMCTFRVYFQIHKITIFRTNLFPLETGD